MINYFLSKDLILKKLFLILIFFMNCFANDNLINVSNYVDFFNILLLVLLSINIINWFYVNKLKNQYLREEKEKRDELINSYVLKFSKFSRDFNYVDKNLKNYDKFSTCKNCFEVNVQKVTVIVKEYYKYTNKNGGKDNRYKDNPLIKEYYYKYDCPCCNNKWKTDIMTNY